MKKIISFVCVAILFVSCHTHSFVPQSQNVPLFTDKHEFRVSTGLGLRAGNIQLAYSPIKYLGIQTNIMASTTQLYLIPEVAIGAYYPIQKKFIFELYGGYAYCDYRYINNKELYRDLLFGGYAGYYKFNIAMQANRYFIQPNIGIKINKYINLALSFKASYWDFNNYSYNSEFWIFKDRDALHSSLRKKESLNFNAASQYTFEPAITFCAGGKDHKVLLQTGFYSYYYEGNTVAKPYRTLPIFIRLGYSGSFDFNSFKQKKSLN
ncbi:MAG: hypothetical protein L6Q66_02080 [Bacteroidia bacterium]|nr:hypothetical protein [Bacteroidia bacterium]